ncbi:sulfate ABC transporter permease [Vibrio panuliri]|uniref:Sulfate ABC transporter permease n=1 Tax=Vibrio panuliri TaxID=1381081 RepID=A0ABX3FSB6_9VIBR|nr:sulfate ABC transporter permease [Vibrio panuliri]KAB1457506.1 sulfate ABC transporter permease [Vibrio panuliri]OLQ95686.1 sulfate ABC transporter permease [Vibrio panuliri]
MNRQHPLLISALVISPLSLANVDVGDNIALSGFGSTSWAKSDNPTPLLINREISDTSCFDCDTTFGLQLDLFYEGFKASAQLVKRPQDKWSDPELEWAYLAYNNDHWNFKIGRLRNPLFLYSEYYYVGQAYTPARPPEEVYNSILGITFYEGASVTYSHDFGDQYTLSLTPFAGLEDSRQIELNDDTLLELETDQLLGLNVTFSSDNYRWNFSYLKSKYDQKVTLFNRFVEEEKDNTIELFSLGTEYEFNSLTLSAEAQKNDRNYSWYLLASNRIEQWTPYISFAQQLNNDDGLNGQSVRVGTRYDIHYNVSLNLEWQQFYANDQQTGEFIATPNEQDANLFTVMLNFVF